MNHFQKQDPPTLKDGSTALYILFCYCLAENVRQLQHRPAQTAQVLKLNMELFTNALKIQDNLTRN